MKYKIQSKVTKYKIQNASTVQNIKYNMQNTQNTKYNTQNAKYKIQVMETGGACLQGVSACDEVHFKWHCPV